MSNRINLTQFERHTPGPWTIVCSIFAGRYYLTQAEERDASDDEDCANADLMEAGPDLLAELKRCYDLLDKVAEQAIPDNEDPELYGYVIDYEIIKSITKDIPLKELPDQRPTVKRGKRISNFS